MAKKKKGNRKVRASFRKKHDQSVRQKDFTHHDEKDDADAIVSDQRISGKGDLTRKRTIIGNIREDGLGGFSVELDVDPEECIAGRVLSVHGLATVVETNDGVFRCATRGLLKNLATELQHVVVAGDHVMIRPGDDEQGLIVRVEPRQSVLCRTSRGRQQIIASNVDQILVVCSAAQPVLKPNLIDRYLISAEQANILPIIVINKVDLVDPADLQPVIGVWSQMGYQVRMVSAETGFGMEPLLRLVAGKDSVVTGQSGVGKSSILNAIQPELDLRVRTISEDSEKGRHTTTAALLIPLDVGGHIVDTPGIRQFQLWDISREEIEGYFRDIRPFINLCRFPDCTHRHEVQCAVKDAVADGKIDARRYESYVGMYEESFRGN